MTEWNAPKGTPRPALGDQPDAPWVLRRTSESLLTDAAEDLLAALETAVASGKSWQGITAARAAIAKAKGE